MKTKIYALIILLLSLTVEAYSQHTCNVDSIVVKHVPWDLMLPATITCHDFEDGLAYEQYCITDHAIIAKMIKEIGKLKEAKFKYMDVRCKLYLFSSGKQCTSACIDSKYVLYDGGLYLLSPTLKGLLDEITSIPGKGKHMVMESSTERYIPFIGGLDSLKSYLLSQSEELYKHICRPISLVVICQIDSQGKTLNVKIKNKDNIPLDGDTKALTAKLAKIFVNEINFCNT